MRSLIEIADATIVTPERRVLFDGLNLRLERDHVALMGRNGVGKSTLLAVLAGNQDVDRGIVRTHGSTHFVPQILHGRHRSAALSRGELRKLALLTANQSAADILLLDEPTEDLDDAGVTWLRAWLRAWPGAVVCASHDPRLLEDFEHFFIASETGCRAFSGSLADLDQELLAEHDQAEQRYARNLHRLAAFEKHTLQIERRRGRKKRTGRTRELDRGTPRIRLNAKRSYAQEKHGKMALIRQQRLDKLRTWSQSSRRALEVRLPLDVALPALEPTGRNDLVVLRDMAARSGDRRLFSSLDLDVGRQRIAVTGPNGSGKTTLLQIMLGHRTPATGTSRCDARFIGSIEQGGTDWMMDESLLELLEHRMPEMASPSPAELLVAHRFPLALAKRPLASLSPGERVRAALIAIFARTPAPLLLILDEPTYSLDRVGRLAMIHTLRAFRGGLVVASHDRDFLEAIDMDSALELDAHLAGGTLRLRTTSSFIARAGLPSASDCGGISPETTLPADTTEPLPMIEPG